MASKIIVLEEKVANQIAAGEVIERPASIVKELVENSIDAGSTRIQVEISEGGRSSIRVLDNGEGISRADVATAFERHATSKIREAVDLFSIRTLGFRGEALPSIASVSKVTLQTRTADEPVGTLLKIEGGEIIDRRDVGLAVGTDFLVEDLFFNTPARLKYLKTTTTELGQISDLFNRIAVAAPEIAMSLSHNGRSVCRTPGTGRLLDVIYSIYGRELVDNLLEVQYEEDYISVTGYVSRPVVYRSSRKHQSYYVNGRYVRSILLSHAVSAAYDNLMPENRNPVVFLFVKINPVHVDVNVHPTKSEIKFSRPEMVADVVTRGIRKTLLAHDLLPTFRPLEKIKHSAAAEADVEQRSLFQSVDGYSTDFPGGEHALNTQAFENTPNASNVPNPQNQEDAEKTWSEHKARNADEIDADTSTNPVLKRLGEMRYQRKNWDPLYRPGQTPQSTANQPGWSNPAKQHGSTPVSAESDIASVYNLDNAPQDDYRQPDTAKELAYRQSCPEENGEYRVRESERAAREKVARYQATPDVTPEETREIQRASDSPAIEAEAHSLEANTPWSATVQPGSTGPGDSVAHSSTGEMNEPRNSAPTPGAFIANLLPIGQIHHTYIIAQGRDGFYVFDQHVVHERVLYEEIMATFRASGMPSQMLLIPLTLELTMKEVQVIQDNEELFNRLGFVAENFGGNTVIVRAVPRRVDERSDKELFLEIVDMLLEDKKAGDQALVYHKLITSMSCKGAIKAGERLEQGEMIQLLQALSKTENPHFCPHGRPIMFHISEQDLLKAFQRI